MDLDAFRARRARVIAAQEDLERFERATPGDVEIREEPTRAEPQVEYTVTHERDGRWTAAQWYWEAGGGRPIASVAAATLELGLDWVWWMGASDFLKAYVRPAAEQKDLQRRETAKQVMGMRRKGPGSDLEREWARVPPSDASTDGGWLGRAAMTAAGADRMRIARNAATPRWALAALALRGGTMARWQIAGNPATGPRTVARLRASDDFGVRWFLTLRSETPTADVVAWSEDDPALWTAILDRPDTTAGQLRGLDDASSGSLRVRIAGHPGADAALLSTLARECDPVVGVALLQDGRIADGDVTAIAMQASTWSASQVQGRLQHLADRTRDRIVPLRVPASVADALARSDQEANRALAAAGDGTSGPALLALTDDPSEWVRMCLTYRADLAPELQSRLSGDASPRVRRSLAGNRRIGPSIATTLSGDTVREVRLEAIRNPNLPADVLAALADGPDAESARIMTRIRAEQGRD